MRLTVFLFTLVVMVWAVVSTPVHPNHLRNLTINRLRRSEYSQAIKGRKTSHQYHNHKAPTMSTLELNLRKGEYVCGNRICKLQPGEVPAGCNGHCQYPI